jgi:acrylyl-CoA reductase (NADPH)
MQTTKSFTAFRIHDKHAELAAMSLDALSPGEVVIRVQWSGINFKDALAGTGKGRIVRRFPLIGGVDLAGVVESSTDASLAAGDAVLVTGCGLSEIRDGGYAGYARVPVEAVVKLPQGLSARDVMAIGTAGFAAALAITQLEHNGLAPGQGVVAVSGASGGVGCLAIDMLKQRGYSVAALTRKAESVEFLQRLGADEVLVGEQHGMGSKPLEAECWAGAVDNVGGTLLSALIRNTRTLGSVASVGLAGGAELNVSLMPFLLRGVNLLGVNSAGTQREKRLAIWQRLATDLKPAQIDHIVTQTVSLTGLPVAFEALMNGTQIGRTLVKVSDE